MAFAGRKKEAAEGNPSGGGEGFGKAVGMGVDKQLSGHKRGGGDIDIEKQKLFTGSYFQVRRVSSRDVLLSTFSLFLSLSLCARACVCQERCCLLVCARRFCFVLCLRFAS